MAGVRSGGDTRPAEAKRLGVVALALVNVGAVLGLRNYPAVALSGWGSIGWYLIGAVCFLIPMALVASELATAWRGDGGIYTWVRTAFGDTAGSVAVFCEWSSNLVRYPAVLAFVASAFVYALDPRLADDGPFMFLVMMVAFWGATLVALLGSRTASVVGAFGVAAGTVAPALVIAGLGIAFIVAGRRPLIPATGIGAVAPHVGGNLPMVGVAILMFSGMEVIGFHTARARDPHHTLPRAMLLSGAIILILAIVGTLAISWVVPASTLELAAGVMQAFEAFLHTFGLSGLFAPLAATQQRPHPRQQFIGAERFHEVIVRAGVEAGDAVLDLPLGREHEDRFGVAEPAQFGAQREAVELREHDVEEQEVGLFLERAVQALDAVGGGEDTVALGLEHVGQRRAHGGFVFDDQQARHGRSGLQVTG